MWSFVFANYKLDYASESLSDESKVAEIQLAQMIENPRYELNSIEYNN
jgi:hypothetical protein